MRDDPGRPGDDGARRGRPPILLLAVNWVVSSVLLAGMSDTLRAPTPAAHARRPRRPHNPAGAGGRRRRRWPRLDDVMRNVVVGRLRAGADEELLDEALRALLQLPMDGLLEMHVGRDARLRQGTWDYVITADFADADAYRRYDADEEHNRLRRELFDVLSEEIARVQFEIPDEPPAAPREIPGESSWAEPPADGRRRRR